MGKKVSVPKVLGAVAMAAAAITGVEAGLQAYLYTNRRRNERRLRAFDARVNDPDRSHDYRSEIYGTGIEPPAEFLTEAGKEVVPPEAHTEDVKECAKDILKGINKLSEEDKEKVEEVGGAMLQYLGRKKKHSAVKKRKAVAYMAAVGHRHREKVARNAALVMARHPRHVKRLQAQTM